MCVRMHTQQSTVTIAAEDIGHMGPASDAVMIRRRIVQMHTQQSTVTIVAGSARTFFMCRLCAWAFVVPCVVASQSLPLAILIRLLFCSFRAVHGRFSSCRLCAWAFVVPCVVASLCLPLAILNRFVFFLLVSCSAVHGCFSSCRQCAWAFVVPCVVASLCLPLAVLIRLLFAHFVQCTDVFHHVVNVLGHLSCLVWSLRSAIVHDQWWESHSS